MKPSLLPLAVLVAAATSSDAVETVTSTANTGPGSLREAISTASVGESIVFAPGLNGATIVLESPLLVLLTLPSSPEAPPECRTKIMADDSKVIDPKKIYSPESQAEWLRNYLPVMLAKNCVQVVVWNQLQDGGVGTIPGAGLLDAQGKPKPALGVLRSMRADYMG